MEQLAEEQESLRGLADAVREDKDFEAVARKL